MSSKAYVKKHTFIGYSQCVNASVNKKGIVKDFLRSFTTPLYQNQLELIKLSDNFSADCCTFPRSSYARTPHPYLEVRSYPIVLPSIPRIASYLSDHNVLGNGECRSASHKLRNYKDRNDSSYRSTQCIMDAIVLTSSFFSISLSSLAKDSFYRGSDREVDTTLIIHSIPVSMLNKSSRWHFT